MGGVGLGFQHSFRLHEGSSFEQPVSCEGPQSLHHPTLNASNTTQATRST